jgi:hypothetical protein
MEPYIVSIVSAAVGYYSSILANRKPKGFLQTIGILTVLAGTAVVLTFLGQWVMKPPPPPPNKLEGQWIEKYMGGDKATYAIATFRYNSEANHLEFSGNAYDLDMRVVGYWRTIQARLDRDQYDYLFEGESGDQANPGHRRGIGRIFFDSPNHGTGTFLTDRSARVPRDFEIDKILNEDAARESMKDPKGFIQKLYQDSTYFKKVTSSN